MCVCVCVCVCVWWSDGECVMREGYACGGEGVGMMACGVCGMFILKCVCVYACMYMCICCMYVCW